MKRKKRSTCDCFLRFQLTWTLILVLAIICFWASECSAADGVNNGDGNDGKGGSGKDANVKNAQKKNSANDDSDENVVVIETHEPDADELSSLPHSSSDGDDESSNEN